ncbi:MbtH family protein [Actinosynnema sp. NPDC050436]|uniref:MbtH family protein n=1 Tax=Actinosynnema sp. NPDC050436 TaxID=3155659 RepID=UPI0033E801CE
MGVENVDSREFLVVVNTEEQYSVWFADRELPLGWRAEGTTGTRQECLDHIARVWTDLRPRSVLEHLAAHGG